MDKIRKFSVYPILTTIGGMIIALFTTTSAFGLSPIQAGALAARGSSQPVNLFGAVGIFTIITNTMLFIIGALSVLMLIIGGLRYVVSGGNASSVTSAKNTVLYAIVGLIVALLAYAAINFILNTLV